MPSAPLRYCLEPGCSSKQATARCPDHTRQKEQSRPNVEIRKLYYTARWQRLRRLILTSQPFCADCPRLATEVDHIIPHRGSLTLFWDISNLAGRCRECHSRKTRRGE